MSRDAPPKRRVIMLPLMRDGQHLIISLRRFVILIFLLILLLVSIVGLYLTSTNVAQFLTLVSVPVAASFIGTALLSRVRRLKSEEIQDIEYVYEENEPVVDVRHPSVLVHYEPVPVTSKASLAVNLGAASLALAAATSSWFILPAEASMRALILLVVAPGLLGLVAFAYALYGIFQRSQAVKRTELMYVYAEQAIKNYKTYPMAIYDVLVKQRDFFIRSGDSKFALRYTELISLADKLSGGATIAPIVVPPSAY